MLYKAQIGSIFISEITNKYTILGTLKKIFLEAHSCLHYAFPIQWSTTSACLTFEPFFWNILTHWNMLTHWNIHQCQRKLGSYDINLRWFGSSKKVFLRLSYCCSPTPLPENNESVHCTFKIVKSITGDVCSNPGHMFISNFCQRALF